MKKSFFVAASLAFLGMAAQAQDSKPLNIASVPVRADAPLLFAPRGWKIEKRVDGDLNRDKIPDAALVLIEDKPTKDANGDPTERRRALVVLLREGKGWHCVGVGNRLLMGTRDGGAFFGFVETPVNISIARGAVVVEMEAGSREVTGTVHRLRYEPKLKGVFWIGFDSVTRDRANGDVTKVSINFLTGAKWKTVISGENNKTVTKKSRISTQLRSLQSLTEDERYSD